MSMTEIGASLALKGESEFREAVKQITDEAKRLAQQMQQVTQRYAECANSLEALSAKHEVLVKQLQNARRMMELLSASMTGAQAGYGEMAGAVSQYGSDLEQSGAAQEKARTAMEGYAAQAQAAQVRIGDLSREIAESQVHMEQAAVSADGCAAAIDNYGKRAGDAQESAKTFGGQSAEAFGALAAVLKDSGIAGKVQEIQEALLDCASRASTFESAVAKVASVTDPTVMSAGDLSAAFLSLSNATGQSADSLAEAAYRAMSAGVDTAGALEFTETAAKLAAGGFMETSTAVDILSTILNAYGREASDAAAVSDMLVKTQNLGKTSVGELASSMGQLIPTAASYKVNLENVAAAYVELTKGGMDTKTSTASLSGVFSELGDSSKQVSRVLVDQTGQSFSQLMGSGASLGDVIGILSDSVNGNADAFKGLWESSTAAEGAQRLFSAGTGEFNASLAQVRDSAGTAAKSYEMLADTTEFAHSRMEAASNNLKIAIGDTLNPALKQLYDTGANAFDWAADFVNDHPALVAGISATVTVMGALTAGIVAVSGAIKALKALSLLSGVGGIAIAIAGVVSVLAGLHMALKTTSDSAATTEEKLEGMTSAIEGTEEVYKDSATAVETAAHKARLYVDRLAELEEQGLDTEESQRQYAAVVGLLNETVPGLNAVIDEQTGLLQQNRDAISEDIDAWEAASMETALYEKHNALIAEQTALKADLAVASTGLASASEELAVNQQRQAEISEEISNIRLETPFMEWAEATAELNGELVQLQVEEEGLKEKVEDCTTTIEAGEEAVAEYDVILGDIEETITAFAEANTAAADSTTHLADTVDDIMAELDDLNAAYEASYESAYNFILGQVDPFNALNVEAKSSMTELTGTLQNNTQDFQTWAENLDKLVDYGVDKAMVQQMREKGPAFAGEVAGYVEELELLGASAEGMSKDAKDAVENVNTAFEEFTKTTQQVASDAADDWAKMDTDFDARMTDIEDRLMSAVQAMDKTEDASTAGINTIQGFIDGMDKLLTPVATKAAQIAQAALDAITATIDSASPSKEGRKRGEYLGQGFALGIEDTQAMVTASATKVAETALSALSISPSIGVNAEQYLQQFNTAKTQLEKLRSQDLISQETYYARLTTLRDQYLQDAQNQGQYSAVSASIQSFLASVEVTVEDFYKELTGDLDYYLSMGMISQAEYYARLTAYRDAYLTEESEAWRKANKSIHSYRESLAKSGSDEYQAMLKDLEHYYKLGLVSTVDYWMKRRELMTTYLDEETEAYRKAREDMVSAGSSMYSDLVSDMDFQLSLGLMNQQTYYSRLEQYRDIFLEKDSSAWRSATQQLYSYQMSLLDGALKDQESAIKDSLARRLVDIDEHLARRKTQIKAELDAERVRVNEIIAGIKDEIAARKQAKAEEGYQDKIDSAQRKVDALQAQVAYERDDENLEELNKELIRAQEDLAKVREDFDQYLWEQEQAEEIARHEEELAALEEASNREIAALEALAEEQKAAAEAAAEAALAAAERKYDDQLNTLVSQMEELVRQAKTYTEQKTGGGYGGGAWYDANTDYAALMLAAESEAEFQYWKNRRDEKIKSEGIDLEGQGYADSQDLYDQWRASSRLQDTVAQTTALAAAVTAQTITNNSTTKNASVTIHEASSLTSGQLEAAVTKVLDRMG